MNERAGSHGLVGGCLAPATQAQCLLGPLTGGLSPPQLRCDLSHLDSRAPGLRLLRLSSWIRLAGIVRSGRTVRDLSPQRNYLLELSSSQPEEADLSCFPTQHPVPVRTYM